jgi:hypothetical protein
MQHKRAALSIAINALCLIIWVGLTVAFLTTNTLIGYIMSIVFFVISLYGGYYFYRILWLHNWGHPLSTDQKRKREQFRRQMGDYQRYNLYNRLYRFADETEEEYQNQKNQETLKKIHRKT